MRKQGVYTRVRFHGRLRVQRVFHFVALLRNRQEVRIGDHIEWIARLLRIRAVADRSIVVTISNSEEHKQSVEGSDQVCAHDMDSPTIVAYFCGGALPCGTRFSLWGSDLAMAKPHRLKSGPLASE